MKRLRTLKSFKIFKNEIKKLKTYSGWCHFEGLSNDTTLMQIQSGRTVPLTQAPQQWHSKGSVTSCLRPVKESKNQECTFFSVKICSILSWKGPDPDLQWTKRWSEARAWSHIWRDIDRRLVYYYSVVRRCNEGCLQFGRIRIFGWILILPL